MNFKILIKELWRSTPGKIGMILLCLLVVVSICVVLTFPLDFGTSRWGNLTLWADNPKTAPPAWTNLFTSKKLVKHRVVDVKEPDRVLSSESIIEHEYDVILEFDADEPPTFLSLAISDLLFHTRPPVITAVLIRPDGEEVVLFRHVASGSRRSEESPYKRYQTEPYRLVAGSDERISDTLLDILTKNYTAEITREQIETNVTAALFGYPGPEDQLIILKGDYRLKIHVLYNDSKDRIGSFKIVLGGSVYGVMGTDALGRDLAEALLFGLPIALLIGISTSTISTLLGMSLGMISGYTGGKTDMVIQRSADIVANVPVLPLLIFLVFIGGSQLWIIFMVLILFSWPGLTIMVRTMVLQLSSGQEVEATKALGASSARIIFRHILPHTASYILAQLVFFAPSAILTEAGLSFLGLGDPSIPTWGQILENGFRTGAVFLGYWWWIIPPGLLIIITAVTFMFLAQGLEPVVDPRLRGKRSWHF